MTKYTLAYCLQIKNVYEFETCCDVRRHTLLPENVIADMIVTVKRHCLIDDCDDDIVVVAVALL